MSGRDRAARRIDVVVPVYNAPADVERCVESVLAHTDAPYRLVLIDDASPDPAIGKLLAALAAWLGPGDAIPLALFSSMAGGACALVVALAHGYLRRAVRNVWLMLMHWRVAGLGPVPGLTLQDGRAPRVAYAIPIAVGVMCTLWRN